jgi:dolichol-phosphate mannosyltransferase
MDGVASRSNLIKHHLSSMIERVPLSYCLEGRLSVSPQVGVILPTYCESQNIEGLIGEIESLGLDASILVIDDSSPDKTAQLVRRMQKEYGNILLCVRPEKRGLGTAITDGFRIFLSLDTPPHYVVTMDADYSHDPKAIPQLLSRVQAGSGISVGSRYCMGGRTAGWSWARKVVSKTANVVAKSVVGLKLHDCTSGFRCYSTDFLKVAVGSLHSQTYEIQIETMRQALSRGFKVVEVPILFTNRKRGRSKLTSAEIQSYTSYVLKAMAHR